MPTVPANNIQDIPKAERSKLEALYFERALLQYRFSYERLIDVMRQVSKAGPGLTVAEFNELLASAIVAWKEEDDKKLKAEINDQITSIYTENGIQKTLRHFDPFGNEKDYIMMDGVATSFSKDRALPLAVAGIHEWKCPACPAVNFTATNIDVYCSVPGCDHYDHRKLDRYDKRKHKLQPLKSVKSIKHTVTAEAFTAIMDLATVQTKYVSLQCRDVKDDTTNGEKKRRK